MNVEDKDQVDAGCAAGDDNQRKPWKKPTIITASVRDHTEDGDTTGTDDGHGNNDFTFS